MWKMLSILVIDEEKFGKVHYFRWYSKMVKTMKFLIFFAIHYRSELWDHLFFDDCLNYLNFNFVSDEISTLNKGPFT